MSGKNREMEVLDTPVRVARIEEEDFISLTDIARHRDADRTDDLVRNWNTVEFLGIWEQLNNPILIPSNSTGLEMRLVVRALRRQGVDRVVSASRVPTWNLRDLIRAGRYRRIE